MPSFFVKYIAPIAIPVTGMLLDSKSESSIGHAAAIIIASLSMLDLLITYAKTEVGPSSPSNGNPDVQARTFFGLMSCMPLLAIAIEPYMNGPRAIGSSTYVMTLVSGAGAAVGNALIDMEQPQHENRNAPRRK